MSNFSSGGQAFRRLLPGVSAGYVHGDDCDYTLTPVLAVLSPTLRSPLRLALVKNCGWFVVIGPLRAILHIWNFGFRVDRRDPRMLSRQRVLEFLTPSPETR